MDSRLRGGGGEHSAVSTFTARWQPTSFPPFQFNLLLQFQFSTINLHEMAFFLSIVLFSQLVGRFIDKSGNFSWKIPLQFGLTLWFDEVNSRCNAAWWYPPAFHPPIEKPPLQFRLILFLKSLMGTAAVSFDWRGHRHFRHNVIKILLDSQCRCGDTIWFDS